jgi:hypothetical protein
VLQRAVELLNAADCDGEAEPGSILLGLGCVERSVDAICALDGNPGAVVGDADAQPVLRHVLGIPKQFSLHPAARCPHADPHAFLRGLACVAHQLGKGKANAGGIRPQAGQIVGAFDLEPRAGIAEALELRTHLLE